MIKYRPEIDGLRAVAVLPVILFHAGVQGVQGGFVGVDVFFVISGYLITSILLGALNDPSGPRPLHTILLEFYERRARRILPALFFVMLVTTVLSFAWMDSSAFKDYAASLIAVCLFGSNFLFLHQDTYFAAPGEEKPLLHTWSLAVEEQFYVLFPLLLFFIWRFGRPRVALILGTLALLSFGMSVWSSRHAPSANFFVAHTRAFELLAGSLAALYLDRRLPKPNQFLSLAGLGLILAAVGMLNSETPVPGLPALVPVGGTVLTILFCAPGTLAFSLLASRVPVAIGLISYSAYLWHQPLFALARICSIDTPSITLMLGLAALSLVLAWLTWVYIEQPVRLNRGLVKLYRRDVFAGSTAIATAFAAFGIYSLLPGSFADHFRAPVIGAYVADNHKLMAASWEPLRKLAGDKPYSNAANSFEDQAWFKDDTRQNLLVIGNSHGKDLYNALIQSKAVMARFEVARHKVELASVEPQDALYSTPNYRSADVVLIASRYKAADVAAVPRLATRMLRDGKRVVIVLNMPEFPGSKNGNLADKMLYKLLSQGGPIPFGHEKDLIRQVNDKYYEDADPTGRVAPLNAKLVEIARTMGVPYIDRRDLMCEEREHICYGLGPNFEKYFYDYGHTTLDGAAFFGRRIDELDWLGLQRPDGPLGPLRPQPLHAATSHDASSASLTPFALR